MTTSAIDMSTIAVNSIMTKNRIALQKGFMLSKDSDSGLPLGFKMSIQVELMQLGYALSEDALEAVTIEWYEDVIAYLRKNLGVGSYRPLYKNFPNDVMTTSDAVLYQNAMTHYWSNGSWEPQEELYEHGIKFEVNKFKNIELGTEEQFAKIFTNLVSINQSLTENDKDVITWFVKNYGKLDMPSRIPFKETLCMLAALGLDVPVTSPTDVLRIAVHLSGGDISLPAIPKLTLGEIRDGGRKARFLKSIKASQEKYRDTFKFAKFKRGQRKYLLALLENTTHDLGEMKLKIGRWLRLGEILHPGEFKNKFPKSFETFQTLRNDANKIQTFPSMLDKAFLVSGSYGMKVLAQNPGLFARKLDWLLRTYDHNTVLLTFKGLASKVSKKVLWELYNHFLKRDTLSPRSIMIKGKKSIRKVLPELEPMSKSVINRVHGTILECLTQHFSKLDPLNNVWIDERLKKIPLPSAMRSVNTSIKTYVRGTRVPFDTNAKVIRPYIHWFDENGREDLDLSVGFYNSNLNNVAHISFTELKNVELNSCHSGDVRHRQGACAEYVDIDIDTCLRRDVRYAMVQVHNFQDRPMHSLSDCVFGLMEREFPESNMTFVPKTITNAMKLANESPTVCVCILDLEKREYIWCDLEIESHGSIMLENVKGQTGQIIRELIHNTKLSVYDLLELHASSRGTLTKNKENSDTKFEYDDFITSYEKTASFM